MPAADRVTIRVIVQDPAVRVAFLIMFVIMVGFGIVAPILPLYARSFGVSYEAASLMISAFAFARLVVDPIAGPLVDRWGERRVSMAGVAIVGVSAFLTGLAPTFAFAVIMRGLGGAGSSLLFAAVYSYLLKVVPSERMGRTFSLLYGSVNVGIIAGGPIGGVVAHAAGLSAPLFTYSALCLVGAVLYLRYMEEPPPRRIGGEHADGAVIGPEDGVSRGVRATVAEIRRLLHSPAFPLVLALNFAFFWVVAGGYDTMVPLFAREVVGLSTVGVGAIFAATVLAELMVLYPAGSAADRVGRKPALIAALAGLAVFMAAIGWTTSPWALGLVAGSVGFFSGGLAPLPAAMLSDVVPGGSGTSVGVFRFAGDLGFVLGPIVGGVVANAAGFRWAFAVMAMMPALVLPLVFLVPETLRRRSEH
jgi:MFS transporter, DHA1 family, multidrug resistance protein